MKFYDHVDDGKPLEPPTKWEMFVHYYCRRAVIIVAVIAILVIVNLIGLAYGAPVFNPGKPTAP